MDVVFFWDSAQISRVIGICSFNPSRRLRWQDVGKALVLPFSDLKLLLQLCSLLLLVFFFYFFRFEALFAAVFPPTIDPFFFLLFVLRIIFVVFVPKDYFV